MNLGSPPLALSTDDFKILVGLHRQESQVSIAARIHWSTTKVCRRIQKYADHQLVLRDAKTGQRVLDPRWFPTIVGKVKPPVQTVTGCVPGGKYSIEYHNLYCYCEVLPSSKADYERVRKTLPLLNSVNGWDRLYIPDKDLGFFGAKRFANPDFMVLSTPRGLFFYPWGWGNTDLEALEDAEKGAEELHAFLKKKFGLNLGCTFEKASKSGKRQPHPVLNSQASMPPVPALASVPSAAPVMVVNGVELRQDGTHPDGIEGTGLVAGRTLSQIGKDLESIPGLVQDHVNNTIQQQVTDAVSKAMQIVIPQLITAVAQSFVPVIKDSVMQGMQSVIPQLAEAMKTAIQQAFSQSSPGKEKPPVGQYT